MTATTEATTKAITDARDAVRRIDDASTALAEAYGDLSAAISDIQHEAFALGGKKRSLDLSHMLAPSRVALEVVSVLRALGLHEVVGDGPASKTDLSTIWEKRLEFVRSHTVPPDLSRQNVDPATRHLLPGQTLPNTARRGLPTRRST